MTLKEADFDKVADENSQATEEEVTKLAGQDDAVKTGDDIEVEDSDSNAAKADEKNVLTFADVKAEDVKVRYLAVSNLDEVLAAGEDSNVEPQYEEREAEVNALSNDGGALTLSFTNPDAASFSPYGYIVSIDAMKLSALVELDSAHILLK